MVMSSEEKDILYLVAQGNDEELTRLMFALLKPMDKDTRVFLLERLGKRYITLALGLESELNTKEALSRLYSGSLALLGQVERARGWYTEALKYLEEALGQASETYDKRKIIGLACLARYALYGERVNALIATSESEK